MTNELTLRERMAIKILRAMFLIVAPSEYSHIDKELMDEILKDTTNDQ
jgi:hypothetical protein